MSKQKITCICGKDIEAKFSTFDCVNCHSVWYLDDIKNPQNAKLVYDNRKSTNKLGNTSRYTKR
jgi:hypothetical protein